MTSLYGALFSDKPVEITKGKSAKKYFYYVDMNKTIDVVKNSSDEEDMIVSVTEERVLKTDKRELDLSTPEKEFAADMFPLNKLVNLVNSFSWLSGYQQAGGNVARAEEFNTEIIQKTLNYQIICIKLDKNTPLEAVCKIFEKVNISGVVLTVFDLLTAILASFKENGKCISLRDDWKHIHDDVFKTTNLAVLSEIDGADFITSLTLLVSYEKFLGDKKFPVGCKRENILKLDPTDYLKYKDAIVGGFVEAAKFLEEEGITRTKYLPYKPQLIPMAAIFAELKILHKDNAAARDKLRQWYWSGVFGEAYRDGHLSRFAKDIVQVIDWIDGDRLPEIIKNSQIVAERIVKLKSIQSAAFKGVVSIIFRNKATDFRSGKSMILSANHDENIDVHHIFPKKYCEDHDLSKDVYDSILNKTPISSDTNKIIGQKAPSVYIRDFEKQGNKPQQIRGCW